MASTNSTSTLSVTPGSVRRNLLLWLSSGFWFISGLFGIVPVIIAIPRLAQASTFVLLFVALAALSHLLSIAGAVQLFRRRRSAIPLLVVVFVLFIGALFFTARSPATWGLFKFCLVAISASTIGYALLLKREGILT